MKHTDASGVNSTEARSDVIEKVFTVIAVSPFTMGIDFLSKIGMRGGKTYYSTRFEFVEIKIGIIGDIIIAHPVSRYWDTGCAVKIIFKSWKSLSL